MKRVVIAAGGTGGHFYPGLAVAQALKARGWSPLMIVKAGDPALAKLEAEGLPALPVDLRGLPRRLSLEALTFARDLAAAMALMSRTLKDYRPDLVVGMGGYLSFPLAYAAWRRELPRAVHESNAILGLANSASAALGCEVFWGLTPHDAKGTVVGTPVRPELRTLRDPAASRKSLGLVEKTTLLAFGGSQGAQALNAALPAALKSLGPDAPQVLHLAGRGKAEEVRAAYAAAGVSADVRDYLEDMASAYAAADLVLCRSGASTLAELRAQAKPAVLVPYPHAAADHQDANARVFEAASAALRLPEEDLQERLGSVLADLIKSPGAAERRRTMSQAYASLGLPPAEKATEIFVTELEKISQR